MLEVKKQKETSVKLQDILIRLEELIVKGKHTECRKILASYNVRKIPRELAVRFGEFAFRINLPLQALKTLQHIIYPENTFAKPASDKEKLIYSTALFKLGAVREALEILDTINPSIEPEALFARSGAHFYNWDYAAGIPFLKEYINAKNIAPYRQLVGKLNLAAGYVSLSDWRAAQTLLEELQAQCAANSYNLLHGNCCELLAQVQLFQGHFEEAIVFLEKAKLSLKDQNGLYLLVVEKWLIFCRSRKFGPKDELENLTNLRSRAIELCNWNTVRECDLIEALVTEDEEILRKVIIGTPSELYRQRARKLFGSHLISKGQYLLHVGGAGGENEKPSVFDPYKQSRKGEALYEKPLLLSLFDALTQDFYQPSTLGFLFQKIYNTEKFNPLTSPSRVLRLLIRLNRWFIQNESPLRVDFKKSEFRIVSDKSIFITIQRGSNLSVREGKFHELKAHFSGRLFSASQVSTALKISETGSRRLLREAVKNGDVLKSGQGRATSYQLMTHKKRSRSA